MKHSPEINLGQICLLGEQDKRRVFRWNQEPPLGDHRCVYEPIQDRSLAQPEAPAVCAWDGDFTYKSLDNLSSTLAVHLSGLGVGPETFVPLCFEKSRWIVVAMLAVMKAGGAFVLLDPSHPPSRLKRICQSLSARLIIAPTRNAMLAADLASRVIVVGNGEASLIATNSSWTPSSATPNNALYAVFTSGSTGAPKGVVIEHATFLSTVTPYSQALLLSKETRVFQFSSFAFDVSIFDTLSTLINGGCVCVPSDSDRWSDVPKAIGQFQANHASLTPTVARILRPVDLPALKTLVLGGEKLAATDVDRWVDNVRLVNLYGASECPLMSLQSHIRNDDRLCRTNHPTGSVSWIVHPACHENLVPIGAVGELLIEGPVVGRGYLNDPERTEQTFISPPDWLRHFRGSECCSRVYKTGDLVQYKGDGTLVYIGRKDTQVKLRGQRIELGEVEHNVRNSFPGAQDVVAEVITSIHYGQTPMMVAFIEYRHQRSNGSRDREKDIPNHSSNDNNSILAKPSSWFSSNITHARTQLHESMPGYMVPTAFLPLTRIPLTTTGKTDRKRLRELAASLTRQTMESFSPSGNSKRAPSTETERILQRCYAEVLSLRIEQVSAEDHLFHRGGDSLTAMKLVAMAREARYHITVQDVFDCPRLSTLASRARLGVEREEATTVPFSLLDGEDTQAIIKNAAIQCQLSFEAIEDVYPCTPLQEGLMALTEQDLGQSFIAEIAYAIPSGIDIRDFELAWNVVAEANPILRTRLILSDRHGMLQTITRERLQWIVSTGTEIADFKTGIGAPLVRFVIYPGQQGSKIVISIHHAIYDGWALPLILGEVEKAFHGLSISPHPFSPFIRYAKSIDGHERYWKSTLAGLETPAFPELPSNTYQPMPKAVIEVRETVQSSESRNFTQNTYLRLAWAIAQARRQGSNDVFYGAVVSGRNAPIVGIESLTAPTVATVPCRVKLDLSLPVRNTLQKIQEDTLTAIPFEQTGLQHIRRFGPAAARACSFQTLLVIQPAGDQRPDLLLKPIDSVVDHRNSSTYAITVYCTLENDALSITGVYDSNVVKYDDMQCILNEFVQALHSVQNHPELLIEDMMTGPKVPISGTATPLQVDSHVFRHARVDDIGAVAYPPLPSATYRPLSNASFSHHVELHANNKPVYSTDCLVLAAWGILQARYSEAPESLFGYSYNNRTATPVIVKAQWDCITKDYLNEVHRLCTGRGNQPANDSSHIPNNEYFLKGSYGLQTLLAIHMGIPASTPKAQSNEDRALTLTVVLHCNNIDINVHFDEDLFHRQQVIRMVLQLEHVLSQLNGELPSILSDINLVSPQDKSDLFQWNEHIPECIDRTIHDFIHEQASSCPDSPAICSWDGEMTYKELNESSSNLARYLTDIGVTTKTFVPLCFEKSMWAIVAMLAVIKAGGAFVPLDASTPAGRLKTIVEQVRAPVILGSTKQYTEYRDLAPTTVIVGPDLNKLILGQSTQRSITVTSENAAYAIFTSGSTGTPKGVIIAHRAFCTASLAFQEVLRIKNRVLQFASYSFDVSMAEILSTLIYGGCVCVPSEEDRRGNIAAAVNGMGANWAMLTPSFANTIDPTTVPTLQTLCLAGEPMSSVHVEVWGPRVELVNAYGPSECSVICMATRQLLTPGCNPLTIGAAVGGASWLVDADNHQRLTPIGAVGELLIEGPNLARGYLNQPEKTAEAFIPRPAWFPFDRDARLYKTGDLGRYLPDGSIAYVGRKDNQIKIRGQRVELGDIEHQIHCAAEGNVSLVLVSYPKSGVLADKLTAILEPTQSDPGCNVLATTPNDRLCQMGVNTAEISQRVSEALPAHMVPAAWIAVDKLPSLLSAKLDRKTTDIWLDSLPSDFQPTLGDRVQDICKLPALTAGEEIALAISKKIATLVSRGDIMRQASLEGREFTVASTGLDSIQVISLIGFLKEKYKTTVPVRKILNGKTTIRSLASLVTGDTNRKDVSETLNLMQEVSKLVKTIRAEAVSAMRPGRTVFITGVTGFLGTQILRQLCTRLEVDKVIVHVRASTPEDAMTRCKEAAMRAQWWEESYISKIEVWPGDLAQPRLGLTTEQWACLTGTRPDARTVNAIIHAGAAVNWYAGYDVLRAANVNSTSELVRAAAINPTHPRLVYVSGGHLCDPNDDDLSLARQLASSSGYSQTKFVAEILVKQFAEQSSHQGQFSIIKPGLIIGTPEEGVVNADDYFWRLIAAAIDIRAYDADCDRAWLTITSSARVAQAIVHNALGTSPDIKKVTYITDGVTVFELWSLLRDECQYQITPLPHDTWVSMMKHSIDDREANHPLWPVKDIFDETQGRLGRELGVEVNVDHSKPNVKAAIRRSIESLRDCGFIANTSGKRAVYAADKVFKRTGNVWGCDGRVQTAMGDYTNEPSGSGPLLGDCMNNV